MLELKILCIAIRGSLQSTFYVFFNSKTVNRLEFCEPILWLTHKRVEKFWIKLKMPIKAIEEMCENNIDGYQTIFMWKDFDKQGWLTYGA